MASMLPVEGVGGWTVRSLNRSVRWAKRWMRSRILSLTLRLNRLLQGKQTRRYAKVLLSRPAMDYWYTFSEFRRWFLRTTAQQNQNVLCVDALTFADFSSMGSALILHASWNCDRSPMTNGDVLPKLTEKNLSLRIWTPIIIASFDQLSLNIDWQDSSGVLS